MLRRDRLWQSVVAPKHGRRCASRRSWQDQLRKNTNAVLGNVKKRDLFHGTSFQTKILALGVSRLGPPPYQGASLRIWGQCPLWVKSGHCNGVPPSPRKLADELDDMN